MFSMTVAAMRRRRIAAAAALAAALIAPGAAAAAAAAPAAQASVSHSARTGGYGGSRAGNAALNWAEGHARGCWYSYGGSSCSRGYDCSGLVMAAFGHGAGIWLPHSTYSMLGNRHLHRISLSQARRGDLMFYGSGHVEINTIWYHQTFGAHHSGQRVGWRNLEPVVASHGRIPGLVTQDRPRAVKKPYHGHRRRYTRTCTEWMLTCPALPGESPRGHHAPAIASRSGIRPARPHARWPCQPGRPAY